MRKILLAFKNAFRGLSILARTERNFKIHLFDTILATLLFWSLHISVIEWILVSIVISMVLMAEGINTAIEKLCDKVEPEYSDQIKMVKDISAGATLIASINAILVGSIILIRNWN